MTHFVQSNGPKINKSLPLLPPVPPEPNYNHQQIIVHSCGYLLFLFFIIKTFLRYKSFNLSCLDF